MRFLSTFLVLTSSACTAIADTSSLQSWLDAETPIAYQGVLNNIGNAGSKAPGANEGIVVASPSTTNPNYFYSWTRDSALTFKCLVDRFIAGQADVEHLIQDYVSAQAYLQTVANPSGGLCTGGLAEPKFYVNQTAFDGPWGRPQRDGPALRATTLISYANHLLARGNTSSVVDIIWPVVQNDLSYVSQYWNQSSFDLWEEIDSSSLFTTAVQYRALVQGQALAKLIGKECDSCTSQAPLVLCFLQSYWTNEYYLSNTGGGRSGKDVNSILTSIHMFDPYASCDSSTLQPCSDQALANHKVVTDSFRSVYDLNKNLSEDQAVAVGRYPEDVYQGGNPWYLSNFAAAEQLYDAVYQWNKQGSIDVTSVSLPFFQSLVSSTTAGTYASDSNTFKSLISAVLAYADGYLVIAQKYTPADGSLAEQFSRSNGEPLSAVDLTWSYAAFLTAANARSNIVPASWNAGQASVPSICSAGSATGPCATATNTAWPGRSTSSPCATPTLTTVTFNDRQTTNYGDAVYVSGSISQLGNWNIDQAVALNADQYTSDNPIWSAKIQLPTSSTFQYKYLVRASDGSISWESDPNRNYNVVGSCSGTATINDSWR